jgi:F420H(2)-dependent biliverdin reductase
LEEKAFLSENKMMTLATMGSDQSPRVVPVAFMHKDGKYYLSSGQKTLKVRNLMNNSHVAFAVEDPTRMKALVGTGTARVVNRGLQRDKLMNELIIHPWEA